jgi:hypothetical protein
MTDPIGTKQNIDPRRRLRELLAVPERERTDAQWDEINTLEIQLAPGNKIEPAKRTEAFPSPSSVRQASKRQAPSPRSVFHKHKKSRG